MEEVSQIEAVITGVLATVVTYAVASRVECLLKGGKKQNASECSIIRPAVPYDRSHKLTIEHSY